MHHAITPAARPSPRSSQDLVRAAAVDEEVDAAQEARAVGAQERDDVADVADVAAALAFLQARADAAPDRVAVTTARRYAATKILFMASRQGRRFPFG
jgi:hypothetical protein